MTMQPSHRARAHFDIPLALLALGLSAFGVLCVAIATFSTSSQPEDVLLNYIATSYYGSRQAIFFFISPVVIGLVTVVPFDFIYRRTLFLYFVACALLGIALLGAATGVKAWIDLIWGYALQPSEFVKLACIVICAKRFESDYSPLGTVKGGSRIIALVAIPWFLTLIQGETGSVLVMVFVFAVMVYFAGIRLKLLGGIILLFTVVIVILYGVVISSGLSDYRLTRILAFVNPSLVDEHAKYQVDQARIAIGSGGRYGIGMFVPGSFSQLDFVPEDWTDFIFSTIGEAFGFVGCAVLLLVYLAMILRMLYLAHYTVDRFGQLTIIGVMGMMLFHVFENIGMNMGLMPVTGIPLPFISYGGSNLVTNMAGIGLVLNITKNRSLAGSERLSPQLSAGSKYSR